MAELCLNPGILRRELTRNLRQISREQQWRLPQSQLVGLLVRALLWRPRVRAAGLKSPDSVYRIC